MGYPMGARMMSGNTNYHEQLEAELAAFVHKQDAILVNFGYQAMVSCIDALVDRNDVIVYDGESHACIIDGVRLHQGKRYVFQHNNMENLEKQLQRATKLAEEQNGAILVITEGVFGMSGNQGKLTEIVELKKNTTLEFFVTMLTELVLWDQPGQEQVKLRVYKMISMCTLEHSQNHLQVLVDL